jgi:hypothetical protein
MGRLCWKRLWLRGGKCGYPSPLVLRKVFKTFGLGSDLICKVFIVKGLFLDLRKVFILIG